MARRDDNLKAADEDQIDIELTKRQITTTVVTDKLIFCANRRQSLSLLALRNEIDVLRFRYMMIHQKTDPTLEQVRELASQYHFQQAAELLETELDRVEKADWRERLSIANEFKSIQRVGRSIQIANELKDVSDSTGIAQAASQLAVFYEIVGDFENAESSINETIDICPDAVEPQVVLARILAHRDEHERSLALLKHILQQYRPNNPLALIRIYYQIAQSCDALGLFDNAYQAAMQAKNIQRQSPQAEKLAQQGFALLATILKNCQSSQQEFVQPVFSAAADDQQVAESWNPEMAHLVGFPRSGTTLLGELLNRNSQISVNSELPIFVNHILPQLKPSGLAEPGIQDQAILQGLRTQYRSLHLNATQAPPASLLIDKKPTNLIFLRELVALFPDSKFLVAVRDPRDAIVSCFLRYFPLTDMSSNFLALGTGCIYYAAFMQIWRTIKSQLDGAKFHEVRYESLCADANTTIDQACRFLNCENVHDSSSDSTGRYIHSPTFAEVRKPVNQNRIERWKNYEKYLKPYFKILDPIAAELGY